MTGAFPSNTLERIDINQDAWDQKQFALEDDVSYKCSCCEADGMQRKRTRSLPIMKPSARFSQPDRCRHQFLREGQHGLVLASTKHLGAVAKASGCRFRSWRNSHASGLVDKPSFDSVQWVKSKMISTQHPMAAKCTNEGQRKLDVCTLDGQQRRSMTFQVARVKKALGSVSQMVKNGNKLVFDQDSSGKDTSYIPNKRTNEKIWLRQENGVYVLNLMVAHP